MSEDAMHIDGFDFDPNNETQWIELDAMLKENDSSSSINVIHMKPTPPPSSSGINISSPFTSALRILFQGSSSSRLINSPAAENSDTAENSGLSDAASLSTLANNRASQSTTSKALGFLSNAASRLIPWSSGRKTSREEVFSTPFGMPADEDVDEGIKAMRGGSLNRVIASSVAAGSMVDNDLTQKVKLIGQNNEDMRKEIMQSFFTKLNRCDVNGLVKIIRNCHELCWLSTPDVFEPVVGRSDIMMLLSLILETYPDGVWQPSAVTFLSPFNVCCTFRFTGTRVFDHPINALYRQIKVHIQITGVSSLQTESSQQLVNDVTEYAVPTDNMTLDGDDCYPQKSLYLDQQSSSGHNSFEEKRFTARSGSDAPPRLINTLQQQQHQQDVSGGNGTIQFPRRTNSMRETKAIEAAVLKEGPTSYRRQLEFMFNESNEIVRIVFTNILK